MKTNSLFLAKKLIPVFLTILAGLPGARAAVTQTWTGTTSADWNTSGNWTSATPAVPGSGDTAQFNGSPASASVTFGTAVGGANGVLINVTSSETGGVGITSTAAGADTFRIGTGSSISIANGAGAFSLGSSGSTNPISLVLGSGAGTYTLTNNSSNTATIGSNVTTESGGTGASTTARLLSIAGTGNWTFNGVIEDSSAELGIFKAGSGTLTLNHANTYGGTTAITGGTIAVTNSGGLGFGGPQRLGTTSGTSVSGASAASTLDLTGAGTIQEAITLNGSTNGASLLVTSGTSIIGSGVAEVDFTNGGSGATGSTVTFSGGGATTSAAATFGSSSGAVTTVTMTSAGSGYTSAPTVSFGAGTGYSATAVLSGVTLTGTNNLIGGAGNLTIQGQIGQSAPGGSFTKTGAGTLLLSGANSYSGGTSITGGTVQVSNDNNLGASTGSLGLAGGTLEVTATASSTGRTLTLGSGTNNLQVDGSQTYSFTNSGGSKITGAGALNITGPGTFVINDASTANDFSGGSSLSGGGITKISDDTALGGTTNGTTINGAELEVTGSSNSVTTSRSFVLGNGSSGTGTISVDSTDSYAISGNVSGTGGALTANGAGTLVLSHSGGNSYTGATTVSNGSLLITNGISGSATGSGSLLVNSGATFGGAGTSNSSSFAINGKVQVGGGGSDVTGQTTITGGSASTIGATANLTFNLNTAYSGASTSGNILNVGNTALQLASGTTLTLNLVGTNIISPNTPYILVAGTDGGAGLGQYAGSGFTVSGLNNEISGLTLKFANSSEQSFYNNSYLFLVNNGSNVDDIEIMVVPEPGTWALMVGGLVTLVFWQRRRSKHD